MTRRYLVVYERGPGNWSGFVPDVAGCVSTGATLEELRQNLSEALRFHLEGMLLDGDLMPDAATHVVEVPEGGAAEWIDIMLPVGEALSV